MSGRIVTLKAFLSMDFYNFNYVRNKLKAMDLTKVTSPGAYALTILYNTYGLSGCLFLDEASSLMTILMVLL